MLWVLAEMGVEPAVSSDLPVPVRDPGRRTEGLAVSWNTANNGVLAEARWVLARFDGVAVIGVDEHMWRHTRRGDKCVTVIIDFSGRAT